MGGITGKNMNNKRVMHRDGSAEKIVMAGSGNVAEFLAASLYRQGHQIEIIYSRTGANAKKLAEKVNARWTDNISDLIPHEGVWIFALTDQATHDIINSIGFTKGFLLHTAGSLPLDIFSGHSDDHGVLYPLQTFSARKSAAFPGAPLCIESNSPRGLERLRKLADSISNEVYEVGSDDRLMLHAGAVFACNFSNHMYAIASEISGRSGLPFKIYHRLIKETAEKALEIDPAEAQTGPAQRNDQIIIKKHLDLLSFSPELQIIYRNLTDSIRKAGLPFEHKAPEKK